MRTAKEMTAPRARAHSGATNGRAAPTSELLVETLELPGNPDPLALLDPAPAGFQAWWHHDGRTLVGVGVARELRSQGPGRFTDLARQMSELPGNVLAFAGGAFADQPARPPGEHPPLPSAAAWIPSILAIGDGQSTTLLAVAPAGAGAREELGNLLKRAAARMQGRQPTGRAASGDPSARGFATSQGVTFSTSDDDFDASLAVVSDRIEGGMLDKVVLARRARTALAAPLPAPVLARALRDRFPTAFAFGLQHGQALFAGASPELLVRVNGLDVASTPAAGTAPANVSLGELRTEKNLREQGLVVAAVAAALEPFCSDLVVGAAHALDAGPVRHLVTDLHGQLSSRTHALELVQALHPTPAVCGTPTQAAFETIAAVEGFDRGWYAGPIGIVSPTGDGTFAIALRAFASDGAYLDRFAGAGIVAGSEAADERLEIDYKLSAMGDLLGSLGA